MGLFDTTHHLNSARKRWLCAVLVCLPMWVSAQSIYACTDAKGRRITSDRPIPDCLDRDQTELTGQGLVKRVIKPPMTAEEREAHEERLRKEQTEFHRASEERRKNRALLTRYPNKATHDKERKEALWNVEVQFTATKARLAALAIDRKKLDDELQFYEKNPTKAPFSLRKQSQDNLDSLEKQKRFLDSQADEVRNVNARFDQELTKLQGLWAPNGHGETGSPRKTTEH
jgi:hypothetical protein